MKKKKRSKHSRKIQNPLRLLAYALFVLSCLGLAGYVYANTDPPTRTDRLVTFHDRGQNRVVLTRATTVQDALKDADITISPGDVAEPALGTQLLSSDSAVVIYRARQILIVDGALRQKVVTAAAAPNEILTAAAMPPLQAIDKSTITEGNIIADGVTTVLTIERTAIASTVPALVKPSPNALTKSKGAHIYIDGSRVAHRETYYDLPMNIVIRHCGPGDYTVRSDGAKIDKDGYILVAANYRIYPKCSIVETSMGLGKVYDTGGFALRYPHGFDLATDWSRADGR